MFGQVPNNILNLNFLDSIISGRREFVWGSSAAIAWPIGQGRKRLVRTSPRILVTEVTTRSDISMDSQTPDSVDSLETDSDSDYGILEKVQVDGPG